MSKLRSLASAFDFFIPAEVLSSVLLVFTMENILDTLFSTLVPEDIEAMAWVAVYVLGVFTISSLNYLSSDESEREELSEDLEDL